MRAIWQDRALLGGPVASRRVAGLVTEQRLRFLAPSRRLEVLSELGCRVEVVYFTPHNWFDERPFVNTKYGWSASELRRFHRHWGGYINNLELATDDLQLNDEIALERSMADFSQQN